MKAWISQTCFLLLLAALCAGALVVCIGEPDRSVPCDPASLPESHVCLATILDEWQGDVLWVDARSTREFTKNHVPNALSIPEQDIDNQLAEPRNLEAIGMSGINGQKLVVYCGTDACGSSETVAKKLNELGMHSQVFILHGGWKALMANKQMQSQLQQ